MKSKLNSAFFEKSENSIIFVLELSAMSVQGYEEYLLLRSSVEALIAEHDRLVEMAAQLNNKLSEAERQLAAKEEEVKELKSRYERAKFSGAILGSGEDAVTARRRVSELVREIDKCIALLDR